MGLDDDAADGAGGGDLGAGGDEVAGLADAEEYLVLAAHLAGPDEVPPCDLLPLVLAGVAAGEVDQEAVGEVGGLIGGQVSGEVQHRQDLVADPGRGEVAGGGRGGDPAEWEVQVRAAGAAREQRLRTAAEVAVDTVHVAGEGDAAHGVRQIPVEAGEEAEAVLAGKRACGTRRPVPGTSIERALPPGRRSTRRP